MRKIFLRDEGILPNTDITLGLHALFLRYAEDTEFVFEPADYYFSPHEEMRADYCLSNSVHTPYRVLAVWMKHMKNCTLRGNGARLWLAGQMQVFTLDRCESITIEGFFVNWEKPLVAEGVVENVSESYMDVYVDPETFPHRYEDGNLYFEVGADEWYRFNHRMIAFEPHRRTVRRGTGDIGSLAVSELGNNRYRLTLKREYSVQVGDLLNMRHNERVHAGIFSEKCRNTVVRDVTFYSCGGLGCLAQFCHDLTYERVHFLPDVQRGRLVSSGRDDGMHVTCCSGRVTVTECSFHALMDDPINVHGCCVTADEIVDDRTLRCRYRHEDACGFAYWAETGDEIAFLDRGVMHEIGRASAASYTLLDQMTFLLSFDAPLPKEILSMAQRGDSLALDNLSHTAEFICTKNRFGSCRARGVLVSTPKHVLIADNLFESSGSAILVAGDSNYWFESGACCDVEITRNIFTDDCLSSMYQFCHGVISICPVVPKPMREKPYHTNIRITDNRFDSADVPVLYAFSCEKLLFAKNRIFKSPSAGKLREANHAVNLSYCSDVLIEKNEWIGGFGDFASVADDNCTAVSAEF
ncbi:MAG: right-handed parallel beta-helix repeat-containing protein [Clostridia bacterium]|nr:right-handed parallel beta-helix repeat-containing protein [Clostridia bacterium]